MFVQSLWCLEDFNEYTTKLALSRQLNQGTLMHPHYFWTVERSSRLFENAFLVAGESLASMASVQV
jgi:hypothetical protein